MDLSLIAYLPVIFLGAIAACFWLVALILFIREVVIGSRGVRVPGRVTGYNDYRGRHGKRMYSAICEATVPDGRTLRCTSGIGTSWQTPPVGTVVTLLYRADDAAKPLLKLGFSRFIWVTVFAGTAAFLTITGISTFLSRPQSWSTPPGGHSPPATTRPSTHPSHR